MSSPVLVCDSYTRWRVIKQKLPLEMAHLVNVAKLVNLANLDKRAICDFGSKFFYLALDTNSLASYIDGITRRKP